MPLRQVYSPLEQEPPLTWEVDIIAVHGLNAKFKTDREHAEGTWSKGERLWLRDDLPQRTPNARIFIYEWKSEAIVGGDHSSFGQRATLFLQEIQIERKGAEHVPLIFLGHSLGGLLIEQALVNSKLKEEKYGSIGEATVGIAFFGTPHCGGNKMMVAVGKMATQISSRFGLLKGRSPLDNLIKDSQFTETLQDNWKGIAYKWKLVSFWGTKDNIVPKDSSSFDWSEDREEVVPLDADHSNVCKFDTENNDVDKTNWKRVAFNIEPLYEKAVGRERSIIAAREAAKEIKNSYVKDESYDKCLYSLCVTNPSDDMTLIQDTKNEYLEGTCSWILHNATYKNFIQHEKSQTLWIHGDPGKGKTMLTISQVKLLQEKIEGSSDILCYFFCDNKDDRRRNAVSILRTFLNQILQKRPETFELFRHDWNKHKEKLYSGPTAQQSLWRILENVLGSLAGVNIWFVIDALDECDADNRNILLKKIVSHVKTAKNFNEKWLLTSRNEPPIREALDCSSEVSLESNAEFVMDDVRKFIDSQVTVLAEKKRYRSELKEQITKTLRTKAEGTFLWVSLACAALRKAQSIKAMQVLKRMPKDLDKLYEQLLWDALEDKEFAPLVRGILVTVSIACRPLNMYELAVLALPEEYCDDKETILEHIELCGSFLTIRGEALYLVHQSAKDFLIACKEMDLLNALAKEHRQITKRCLDYICGGVFEDGGYDLTSQRAELVRDLQTGMGLNDDEPEDKDATISSKDYNVGSPPSLLIYPVIFWPVHASSASREIGEEFEKRKDFFAHVSATREAWFSTYDTALGLELEMQNILHLATFWNIVPLVTKLLDWNENSVTLKDNGGQRALEVAIERGNEEIVQLLLSRGVNVNEQGTTYQPLRQAMLAGHVGIVRHLLDYKADMSGYNGESELHWAASHGHEEMTHLLLQYKADVSVRTVDDTTPLHDAALNGHEKTVGLLLKWKADISAITGPNSSMLAPGMTPLHMAVKSRNSKVVSLLLANKADVNARQYESGTPLLIAARYGDDRIVRLLLESGADPNLGHLLNQTLPLYVAAKGGHEKVVILLLAKGADASWKGEKFWRSALSEALKHGHEEIASLLMASCAKAGFKHDRETALHTAVEYGRSRSVSLLLANGAHIDSKNNIGEEALHVAAGRGHTEVVRILLANGARIDCKNDIGEEALHIAAGLGHIKVVSMLLTSGADINARWECKRECKWKGTQTAVHNALHGTKSVAVIKFLLGFGISLSAEDFSPKAQYKVTVDHDDEELSLLLQNYGLDAKIKMRKPRPLPEEPVLTEYETREHLFGYAKRRIE